MGPPLNSAFLFRRESLVGGRGGEGGGTPKLSLLVKEAGISGGPTILRCTYMHVDLGENKCPHKCMLIVLLCKVP